MNNDYRDEVRNFQREFYWSFPRVLIMGVFAVVALCAIGWLVQGSNFFLFKTFAPQYEAVRRDTMIQSRAYSEATTRELYRLRLQYAQARTDDEKSAIRALAIHEASAFDRDRLPSDLKAFLISIGG